MFYGKVARSGMRAAVRASGRALACLAALVAVMCVAPHYARAEPHIEVNGAFVNSTDKGYVVLDVDNAFDATLVLLGVYDKKSELTPAMRAYLSNSSTGGNFTVVSYLWRKLGTNGTASAYYPPWLGGYDLDSGFGYVSSPVVDGWVIQYGYGRCLSCAVSDEQITLARHDFDVVFDGGTVGGGGGDDDDDDGDFLQLTMVPDAIDKDVAPYFDDTITGVRLYANSATLDYIRNSDDILINVRRYVVDNLSIWQCVANKGLQDCTLNPGYTEEGKTNFVLQVTNEGSDRVTYKTINSLPKSSDTVANRLRVVDGNLIVTLDADYVMTDSDWPSTTESILAGRSVNLPALSTASNGRSVFAYYASWDESSGGGGGDEPSTPTPPSSNWPDEPSPPSNEPPTPTQPDPVSPTPPDVPPTGDPILDPPTSQQPDTTVTVNYPTTTVNPSGTSPTDYTPWLRAILEELRNLHTDLYIWINDILDALDNHCLHIREAISALNEWLANAFVDQLAAEMTAIRTEINQDIGWLSDAMATHIYDLETYLGSLAQWIVDHIEWSSGSAGQYDDTSVLYWLRAIYNKLGSGNVSSPNTKPTDPATEFDPWGQWLNELWRRIMQNVEEDGDNAVNEIQELLENLKNRFPFSIPWDLFALLTAFGDVPVAPNTTITIDGLPGHLESFDIDIDMSPYDETMETVRQMEMIAFVVYVFVHSKELFAWDKEWF